jgi:hypothetical protein
MGESKNLIAYCGLYCGDCFGYKGEIADLARDLRKELRKFKFEQTASGGAMFPTVEEYQTCYKVLGQMVRLRCKRTCRGGGGPPWCKIRQCCQKKEIQGCWECDEFEMCKKLDFFSALP